MAYEKHEWECGELVTTELLNHMEDGIAEAGGFSCETETDILYDGVVSLIHDGFYIGQLDITFPSPLPPSLTVTWEFVEYTLPLGEGNGYYFYGGVENDMPSFANYPVFIDPSGTGMVVADVDGEGTYNLAIEVRSQNVEISECFEMAVGKANAFIVTDTYGVLDKTYHEIQDAFMSGKSVILDIEGLMVTVCSIFPTYYRIIISDGGGSYEATSYDSYPRSTVV